MQSIKHQHFEVATNIGTGFILAYLIQYYCVPWFIVDGILTPWASFKVTIMFTCVTYLRGLFWRKWYNRMIMPKLHPSGERTEVSNVENSDDEMAHW